MTQIQIILPECSDDPISDWLIGLTREICKVTNEENGYGLGGRFGYGEDFENDVFMMHRYCWCEKKDCPWCSECQTEWPYGTEHKKDCYQWRVHDDLRASGWTISKLNHHSGPWVPMLDRPESISLEKARVIKERIEKRWCDQFRFTYPLGAAIHCSCGAEEERKRQFDECECDWHTGRGVFRFGKAVSAPNFLHKSTGAKISWYKYIGRDMEVSKADWPTIFKECFLSLVESKLDE